MASYSAAFLVGPKTLSGTGIDTITLTNDLTHVDVQNLTGDTTLTVTANRGTAPSNPVAGAADNYFIPAGMFRTIKLSGSTGADAVVKILGNGNSYAVEGVA